MRFFAITALVAGLAAATEYGAGPSTIVLTSTDVKTITSCAGGCGAHSTPVPVVPTPQVPALPETCLPVTQTVTVTVPAAAPTPPAVKPSSPALYPSHPSGGNPPVGTGVPPTIPSRTPTPTPSPPAFTGAASQANTGLFVAGVGAFAAFFL